MISGAGWWTWIPSATPLQPKKWSAHFWITFNFWWLARLVDGLKPHLLPLSSQRNEMLIFGLCSTSDDRQGRSMDSKPIHHPSPAKKMKCLFLDYFQLLMIGQAGQWTRSPSTIPLQPKNEMLISGLCSTSDDQLGWSMDSNPICHPSPNKKMICSFLYYIQLLMIGQAGQWTRTPSVTSLQPKIWNACFWITFNFWWSARLVKKLKPHLQPLSNQQNEMLVFALRSTCDDRLGWSMDSNPICYPSPATKMKCSFLDYFQFRVISQAGWWTQTPSTTPLQPKNAMLIFGLRSTFDDRSGWSMDLNPICHPSPTKKNDMLIFGLCSTSDDRWGWLMDSNCIHYPSPAKKMKCSFLYTFNFWWLATLVIGLKPHPPPISNQKKWNAHFWITFNFWWSAGLVDELESHLPPLSSQKYEVLIFGLCSTSDDWPGWSMDSNPICHPSPGIK